MLRRLLVLTAVFGWSSGGYAQLVKEITVSQGIPYTDHLSLKEDSRDMDLMVKFVFNEEANTLTVSLISYRSLFVFWDQVRYKPAFKGRKLRPKMLPYVAECGPNDRFLVSKLFKYTIPKPRKKYVFNRWNQYEGLQPAPQDYKLVNDYISQTFDILNKRNQVCVTLRDIFIMENTGYTDYEIFFGKDMFTKYQVNIQRNPCFGKDEDLKSAKDAESAIATAYATFKKKYGSGKVGSEESLRLFGEMQTLLVTQYPHRQMQSDCPDIQDMWDHYNQYADSISRMTCVVVPSGIFGTGSGVNPTGLIPRELLLKARQIDQIVSRWLNSKDVIERRDLLAKGEALINEGTTIIKTQGANTSEQQKAVSVFRQAETYFIKMCKTAKR